jgi:hypothetical protein
MAYKILGFLVWKGAKLYLARRYGRFVPSRKVASAGLVAVAVTALAVAAARREATE